MSHTPIAKRASLTSLSTPSLANIKGSVPGIAVLGILGASWLGVHLFGSTSQTVLPDIRGPVSTYSDEFCGKLSGSFTSVEDLQDELRKDVNAQDKYISFKATAVDGGNLHGCYLIDWSEHGKASNRAKRYILINPGVVNIGAVAPDPEDTWNEFGEPNDRPTEEELSTDPDDSDSCFTYWSQFARELRSHGYEQVLTENHPNRPTVMGS